MAHTCPDCGQLCHCGGDSDDLEWGDDTEEAMNCTHYLSPGCDAFEDDEGDDWPDEPDSE